jgi:hypothetical protein
MRSWYSGGRGGSAASTLVKASTVAGASPCVGGVTRRHLQSCPHEFAEIGSLAAGDGQAFPVEITQRHHEFQLISSPLAA